MKRTARWSCSVLFSFSSNSLAKATWWWMLLYRTLRKIPGATKVRLWQKHVSRDSMCCCYCRLCCGAPTTDERIHAPVLHDASQIDYCRYWGRGSLPPTTSKWNGCFCSTLCVTLCYNNTLTVLVMCASSPFTYVCFFEPSRPWQ